MLIDSHAHLNFDDFKDDWQNIISDCQKNDVWMINVGSQLATSQRAVEIADQYSQGVYAAVGLHPIHVLGSSFYSEEFNQKSYQDLIQASKKTVAIGETGLDFFHKDDNLKNQQTVFVEHINLAKEYDLPLILHSRNSADGQLNAYDEILKILKQEKAARGVIHCFGGTIKQALEFLNQGFFIGFTGIITFKNAKNIREVAENIPLDLMLIETDSPYLAPDPHRSERNIPQYVRLVAEKIAEVKGLEYNKVAEQTAKNAINLFKLK